MVINDHKEYQNIYAAKKSTIDEVLVSFQDYNFYFRAFYFFFVYHIIDKNETRMWCGVVYNLVSVNKIYQLHGNDKL